MFRIVRIFDGDGTRTRPDRATPMQIAHIFRTRYSGGRGKPSPLGREGTSDGAGNFKFEISDFGKRQMPLQVRM